MAWSSCSTSASPTTLARYMETLFEEEIASGPELDTSEDVVARIALLGADPESEILPSVVPQRPCLAVSLLAAAVLVLIGILAVSGF